MYFVSDFLEYTVTANGVNLSNIKTLNPRKPELGVEHVLNVAFTEAPPAGKVYCFIDRLQASTTVRDVTGGVDYDTVTDPYMNRSRVLFSMVNPGVNRMINLNLSGLERVGTMVFFHEDSVLRTSDNIIVAPPFRYNRRPRNLTIRKADGTNSERPLADEPVMRLSINVIPKGDFTDFTTDLRKFLDIISPRNRFLFVGEEGLDWNVFIVKQSSDREVSHGRIGYNRQSIRAINLEVA